jgi:TrmH family RNA methyltransferase
VPDRITSTANPLVKSLARLKERRGRAAANHFLIEGGRELARAAAAEVAIDQVVVAPDIAGDADRDLAVTLAASGAELIEMGAEAFGRISMRRHPDGLLGTAPIPPRPLGALTLGANPLVLVIESVEKPGNVGAMLRTADGAAVDAIVVASETADLWNPNVIRASQGAVFTVAFATASTIATLDWIGHHGLQLVAASPEADRSLWEADLTVPTAIVVGAEDSGLTPAFRSPETTVSIPMAGTSDSLNASVAAAVMLYEAVRQRGGSAP